MQIQMPALLIIIVIKMADGALQLCGPYRLIAGGQLLPAAAKQPVQVALQITLITRQRLRVANNHQQPPAERQLSVEQLLQQPVHYLNRRGFIAVNRAGNHQRAAGGLPGLELQNSLFMPYPAQRPGFACRFAGDLTCQGHRQKMMHTASCYC